MKRTNKNIGKIPISRGKASAIRVKTAIRPALGIGNQSPVEYILNYKPEDQYIYFEDIYDITEMDEKYGVRNEPFYHDSLSDDAAKDL